MAAKKVVIMRLLPSFPFLGALLAATAILLGTWIIPAQAGGQEQKIPFGESHVLRWTTVDDRTVRYEWTYEADIPNEEDSLRYSPKLPISIQANPGPNAKESNVRVDVEYRFNGKVAYRHIAENGVLEGQEAAVRLHSKGGPIDESDVDFSALHAGLNTIEVITTVTLTVTEPDSSFYDIRVGAPWIRAYHADEDGDGVLDNKQLVPFHTAFMALPATAGAGAVGWWGGRALQRWAAGRYA